MSYLEKYSDVRRNPGLLLEGAQSVILTAFSYANPDAVRSIEKSNAPRIAEYALGTDYHEVIKERLRKVGKLLEERHGGTTRVCIDTAPLRERYWARQAGIGYTGVNNQLIIPGKGAHFCLGTILWTEAPVDGFDKPCADECLHCNSCVKNCPGKALNAKGELDARRCLSYLTIEHKGEIPPDIDPGRNIFGCDVCRRVCPLEPSNPQTTNIPEFIARTEILSLTSRDWENMSEEKFNTIFRKSAVRRAKKRLVRQ